MKRPILFISILLTVFSCQSGIHKTLNQADALLQQKPDSALVLLQSINSSRLKSKQSKAHYALLMSAALDKNYIDISSDSLINRALKYYSQSKDRYHRMMSYYYQGIVLQNANDYTSSIISFEKAEKDALELEDFFYLGMISRNKSHIYNLTNNPTAAIQYQKNAIHYFQKADKDIYAAYSILSLAIEYINNQSYDSALLCLDEINGIERLQNQCVRLKAEILVNTGKDYEQAINLYERIPSSLLNLHDCALLALAYENCNNKKKADQWLSEAYRRCPNDAGKGNVEYLQGRIEALRGNYQSAFLLTSHACSVQDSVTRAVLQQSVSESQRDYYKSEVLLQEEIAGRQRDRGLFAGLIAILLLTLAGFAINTRIRMKDRLIKEQMISLSVHQQELIELRKGYTSLTRSLFREKINHLDLLSGSYLQADNDKERYLAFKHFKEELVAMRKNEDFFLSLENDLNSFCNGVMTKLKKQVPSIKGENRKIIMLFFSGLPYDTVQMIMNKSSIDSLKMARSRYRRLIKEAHAKDNDLFIDMLDMKKAATDKTNDLE